MFAQISFNSFAEILRKYSTDEVSVFACTDIACNDIACTDFAYTGFANRAFLYEDAEPSLVIELSKDGISASVIDGIGAKMYPREILSSGVK